MNFTPHIYFFVALNLNFKSLIFFLRSKKNLPDYLIKFHHFTKKKSEMTDRQLDILATRPDWFTLPRHLPMRLNGEDFVYFRWPEQIDPTRYTVAVEVLDNAGPPYRGIGPLKKSVELPHVKYAWHGRIGVIPDSESLPAFEAEMIRGSTYIIPNPKGYNGWIQMERHGMHRPNGL